MFTVWGEGILGSSLSVPHFSVCILFFSYSLEELHAWNFLLVVVNHLCLLQRKKLLLHCLKNQSKGNICSKLLASNYCLLCIITYWSNMTKLKLFFSLCLLYALLWYEICGFLKINLQLKLCLHRAESMRSLLQLWAQLEHSERLPLKGLLFTPP